MKHLAKIQSEFLKEAAKWDELSLDTQKDYLKQHPKSKRRLTAKPVEKKRDDFPTKGSSVNYHGTDLKISDILEFEGIHKDMLKHITVQGNIPQNFNMPGMSQDVATWAEKNIAPEGWFLSRHGHTISGEKDKHLFMFQKQDSKSRPAKNIDAVKEKLDKKKIESIGNKIRDYAVKSYAKLMDIEQAESNTGEEPKFVSKIGDAYYFIVTTRMGSESDMNSIFKYDSKKQKIKEFGETDEDAEELKKMTEEEMKLTII